MVGVLPHFRSRLRDFAYAESDRTPFTIDLAKQLEMLGITELS